MSIPTYPSKVIDYLRVGIPTLALIEDSTDFGEILEANNVGLYSLTNEIDEAIKNIERLFAMKNNGSILDYASSTKEFYNSTHNVKNISHKILALLGEELNVS